MTQDEIHIAEAGRIALRRIFRKLHAIFIIASGEEEDDDKRLYAIRCNGECVCQDCGVMYWQHTTDPFARYLNVLCDGTRVKL